MKLGCGGENIGGMFAGMILKDLVAAVKTLYTCIKHVIPEHLFIYLFKLMYYILQIHDVVDL